MLSFLFSSPLLSFLLLSIFIWFTMDAHRFKEDGRFRHFCYVFAASISLLNIARRLVYVISAHGTAKYQMALVMGYMGFLFSFGFIASAWLAATLRRRLQWHRSTCVGYFSRQHSWKPSARGRLLGAQLLWRQFMDFLT